MGRNRGKMLVTNIRDLRFNLKNTPPLSACIKFFGSLSYCYPEAITAYPAFLPAVIDQVYAFRN